MFLTKLCAALKLSRPAPLLLTLTGMNDSLNGVEHPVCWPNERRTPEVVQSLANDAMRLWRYNFADWSLVWSAVMNAIVTCTILRGPVGLGTHHHARTSAIPIRWKTPSVALLTICAHSTSSSGTIHSLTPAQPRGCGNDFAEAWGPLPYPAPKQREDLFVLEHPTTFVGDSVL